MRIMLRSVCLSVSCPVFPFPDRTRGESAEETSSDSRGGKHQRTRVHSASSPSWTRWSTCGSFAAREVLRRLRWLGMRRARQCQHLCRRL